MRRNSRFALALHTISHMATGDPKRWRTSADIADHAGTNPVVVRRVLGKLRDAGLVTSEKGHAGGWRLADVDTPITLADVYLALGEQFLAQHAALPAPTGCGLETELHLRLADILSEVEHSLVERLRQTEITDIRG